jgi:3-oxoacyl-[acyl-carrier protein] reductase
MPNKIDLEGRFAVVTGGVQGIGRAITERFLDSGAAVAIWDRDTSHAAKAAQELTDRGKGIIALHVDVADHRSVELARDETMAAFPRIDILVNNAGIGGPTQTTWDYPLDAWRQIMAVNLDGPFHCCRAVVPQMIANNYGRIVNIASVAGLVGSGGGPAYTASKHGVVGLTKQLAITYAARGVTVNAICPGAIQTGLRANSTRILGADAPAMAGVGGDEAAVRAITPAGRRGTLDEIAAAACYLASEEADYVTGHTLVIDGGWTAR